MHDDVARVSAAAKETTLSEERRRQMSEYNDRQLTCADCNRDFTWTAGEQEFFHEKGFTNPPKRCKECRQAKKDQRGGGERKGGNY